MGLVDILEKMEYINNIKSQYMKKLSKITESIWSDIQDRSMGKTVRKEDDMFILVV